MLANLVEEDGGTSSILQMNSGLDSARNFYGVFRLVQNGTTNAEVSRRVMLKTEANRNEWPMAKTIGVHADDMGFVRSV